MPLKVWNGSSWQLQAQIRVWNGSSWATLGGINNTKTARVWNGSSWVQFHPGVRLNSYANSTGGSGSTIALYELTTAPLGQSTSSEVILEVNSNGVAYYTDQSSYNYSWLLTGANSEYYAYMDAEVGSPFTTSAGTDTSLQLNTTRSWSLFTQTQGSFDQRRISSLTSTLRIKNSSGTDIITIPVSMYVEAVTGNP